MKKAMVPRRSFIICGTMLTAIAGSLFYSGHFPGGLTEIFKKQTNNQSMVVSPESIAKPTPAGASPQSQNKAEPLRRSKDQWLQWMSREAHFGFDRINAERSNKLFICDPKAFNPLFGDKILGDILYRSTFSTINEWIQTTISTSDLTNLTPQEAAELRKGALSPELIADSETASTYLFKVRSPISEGDAAYMKNREKRFLEAWDAIFKYTYDLPDEVKAIGPEWAEAALEWCLSQPAIRRFGNSELKVTFEYIELDGKSQIRTIETMPGRSGGPPLVCEFITENLPSPYNNYLQLR